MEEGYLLMDENIIYEEEEKYYFMMKVRWLGAMTDDAVRQKVGDSWKTEGLDPGLTEKVGPLLLSRRVRMLREYLEWMPTIAKADRGTHGAKGRCRQSQNHMPQTGRSQTRSP